MKVLHLYISGKHNFYGRHGKIPGECPVEEKPEIECVAGRGIRGDRFFDYKNDYKGQITFFANEVYEDLCAQMGVHDRPSWVFRRNVITHGADLNSLIGQKFEIQGVRFFGTEESTPCNWMNQAFGEGAE
jgi:MOSC domain-containing protein YiiM